MADKNIIFLPSIFLPAFQHFSACFELSAFQMVSPLAVLPHRLPAGPCSLLVVRGHGEGA
jgi:hypothetical protein